MTIHARLFLNLKMQETYMLGIFMELSDKQKLSDFKFPFEFQLKRHNE